MILSLGGMRCETGSVVSRPATIAASGFNEVTAFEFDVEYRQLGFSDEIGLRSDSVAGGMCFGYGDGHRSLRN
jgi:hypothetical protein